MSGGGNFAAYATNVAFRVELSKKQLEVMIYLFNAERGVMVLNGVDNMNCYRALIDKGVIERAKHGFKLTAEGKLLIPLLRICGLFEEQRPTKRQLRVKV